jgi:hypothetical protein
MSEPSNYYTIMTTQNTTTKSRLTNEERRYRDHLKKKFVETNQLDSTQRYTKLYWAGSRDNDLPARVQDYIVSRDPEVAKQLLDDGRFEIQYILTENESMIHPMKQVFDPIVEVYGYPSADSSISTTELLYRTMEELGREGINFYDVPHPDVDG